MPRISIVMPVYNRAAYVREAVASVRRQTFTDWELLIADDGSDAATRRVLDELEEPGRITIFNLAHSGRPAVARNAALQAARGDWVAFLDSDDLWVPHKLELQLSALRAHPDCGWSYSAFRNVEANGVLRADESRRRFTPCDGWVFERMLRGEVSIRTPAVLVARGLLRSVGDFDETLDSAEDYDLWLRLALVSRLYLVAAALVDVRHHDQQHSERWSSAYRGQDLTFRKLTPQVAPALQVAVRRARIDNALRFAAEHRVRGEWGAALQRLLRSAPFACTRARYWRQLLTLLLASLLPVTVMAQLRRLRDAR